MTFRRTVDLDTLEEENERKAVEMSIAEKQALIRQAEVKYGKDWRRFIPKIKSGIDWQSLKFQV